MIPKEFHPEKYIQWHENKFKEDKPLRDKIEHLMADLKVQSKEKLKLICSVLEYSFSYCKNEYRIANSVETTYDTPLINILADSKGVRYDELFKSTSSIINKLWRNNRDKPEVNLTKIRERMTDLIRTEIVTPTLDSAKYLSIHMNTGNLKIMVSELRKKSDNEIDRILFEPEMKMASGYFAYHGLVNFKDGTIVELQIYSSLMKTWRYLSHKLYEKVRLEPEMKHEFGTAESRLISLGHLLHLAECEIRRLEQEI